MGGAIDQNTVTRWLKKFHSGSKNFDDQAKSSRPKTIDLEIALQTIGANPVSSTQGVSGEVSMS